jgi:DNA polymerase
MFVGEAPGRHEDEQGLPFVGQAGQLLNTLLGEIGLAREDVFIANVLKCRPPGNRDPHPAEVENCQDYLSRQVELIRPTVICTLGNFATKLLRHDMTGITRLHGRAELRVVGTRAVRLLPLFHPAAALYTPSNVDVLRRDFSQIPALIDAGPPAAPEQPAGAETAPVAEPLVDLSAEVEAPVEEPLVGVSAGVERPGAGAPAPPPVPAAQLGLF